jgi:hypothetical protein
MKTELEKVAVKSHIIGWTVALVLCMMLMYQQSKMQAVEFKAHVAQELLEKSQDQIVNNEVSR